MRRGLVLLTTLAVLVGLAVMTAPASGAATGYTHLDPRGQPRLAETVPVNVVFVGYDEAQVPQARYSRGLPAGYEPVVRSRLGYGTKEALGISYTYDYNLTYADTAYENRFFAQLSRLAQPAPLTSFQQLYNQQASNVLTVRNNHHIDAPTVERWLATHPPSGVDTTRNTVFFVNWFGRTDFKFHVYT